MTMVDDAGGHWWTMIVSAVLPIPSEHEDGRNLDLPGSGVVHHRDEQLVILGILHIQWWLVTNHHDKLDHDGLELPCSDCFADSTPLGFNTLLQGAAHLGRLTGFACKSFSIVNPGGRQLKALCRQLRVWNFFWSFKVLNPSSVETKWC